MREVLALVRGPRAGLAVVLGALTVLAGAALLATSGALITGAAQRPRTLLVLMPLITGVRLFGVARAALRYAERLVTHDVTLRAVAAVRERVLERLVPLAPAALVGVRGGELLARVRADVDQLQGVVVRLLAPAGVAVLAGGAAVTLTALVSPPTAAVLAGLLLVLGTAVPAAAARAGRRAAVAAARADADVTADTLDLVRGLTDHLTADGGATALRALDGHLQRQEEAERAAARLAAVTTLCREGVPGLGLVAALWIVGQDVARGDTGAPLLAACALGVLGAFEAVGGLGAAWSAAGGITAAARRVAELGNRRPAVADPLDPLPPPAGSVLRLEDVTVRHPGAPAPVLAGLDLDLPAGAKVALTGPSGAGKSTVLALAARVRDPDAGRVALGGTDLRRLPLDGVRSRVLWSAQEPQVLGSTLAANLRLGRQDATDDELLAVLADLGLGALAVSPGLGGWVGEGGSRLSAGERARVALARVLLSRADVLLLDEPTAHLDPATAERVLGLLARDPRAVLLVTHDAAALDDRWRIVGLGAPAPLSR
ncbi:thiol reductant ABC exporter subunit CydC [Geodermatophilus sp. FMUSA9-8]|uniref:thiol reductant ABC exporter subunit CydC n=1 Tax=Geodermatophilus sp. FMUSA9-8 TaxID=3120155 RepID=UPI00300A1C9B